MPSATVSGEQPIETDAETHSQALAGASGDPAEDREEGLEEPEEPRTPRENPRSQLTWAHEARRE